VQALAGEKRAKMLGESDRESKLLDTSSTALAGKQSGQSLSRVLKRQGFEGPLKTHDLKASENNKSDYLYDNLGYRSLSQTKRKILYFFFYLFFSEERTAA